MRNKKARQTAPSRLCSCTAKLTKNSRMEQQKAIFNISETIRNIRKARQELERAIVCYRSHSRPILTDLSMIPVIYDWFCELSVESATETVRQVYGFFLETVSGGAMSVERRRQFIFVILYLYAPNRLFSGKMPKGLRRAIARTLGVQSDTVLSDNANDVLKRYEIYKSWAKDVEDILCVILARLQGFYDNDRNVVKQGFEND